MYQYPICKLLQVILYKLWKDTERPTKFDENDRIHRDGNIVWVD